MAGNPTIAYLDRSEPILGWVNFTDLIIYRHGFQMLEAGDLLLELRAERSVAVLHRVESVEETGDALDFYLSSVLGFDNAASAELASLTRALPPAPYFLRVPDQVAERLLSLARPCGGAAKLPR